jgi:ATP-dependent DNA helicase RecG
MRCNKNLPFDIYPVASAKASDISRIIFENEYLPQAFAEDVLEANNRSYAERLASCKMVVSPSDTTPTITGLLALGKSPQDYIPGAYIQFLRIDGTELADSVEDEANIRGTLVEMLRIAEEKLRSHNRINIDIHSSPTHQKTSPYPSVALQQILYNAVLHRTYESTNAPIRVYWFNDRIEINSPGGPFGNVTSDNFGQPSITDYRNPNIADVLKTFGFIQAFGRGIAVADKAMRDNGNPPLTFETNQHAVVCILRNKS